MSEFQDTLCVPNHTEGWEERTNTNVENWTVFQHLLWINTPVNQNAGWRGFQNEINKWRREVWIKYPPRMLLLHIALPILYIHTQTHTCTRVGSPSFLVSDDRLSSDLSARVFAAWLRRWGRGLLRWGGWRLWRRHFLLLLSFCFLLLFLHGFEGLFTEFSFHLFGWIFFGFICLLFLLSWAFRWTLLLRRIFRNVVIGKLPKSRSSRRVGFADLLVFAF